MKKLTYKQAFDKITEAYIKGEIKPHCANFCFCGTLNDNDSNWCQGKKDARKLPNHNYYPIEFFTMEYALFKPLIEAGFYTVPESSIENQITGAYCWNKDGDKKVYEDALFNGMSAALDVLRQIHIERGEVIDESPVFTKRQLA